MLTKQDKTYFHKTFATKQELNQLALDVGTEFEHVHEKMDQGFARMDKKFDKLEKRFDSLEGLLKNYFITTVNRVEKIEAHLGLAIS